MGGCCCCPGRREKDEPLGNPIAKRRCTDVICFLVYFTYWLGLGGIVVYCVLQGRVERLINGYDSYGNTCGVDNSNHNGTGPYANLNLANKKYQFFMNYLDPFSTLSVCVESCPSETITTIGDLRDYHTEHNINLCDYRYEKAHIEDSWECELKAVQTILNVATDIKTPFDNPCLGPCPAFEVPAETSVLNRCFPQKALEDPLSFIANLTSLQSFVEFAGRYAFFSDITASFYAVRYDLLYLLATGFGLALIVVFLMRFVIKIVVWFVVVMVSLLSIGVSALLWYNWYLILTGTNERKVHQIPLIPIEVKAYDAFLAYSIIATVLTLILLLVLIVLRKRLQLAVALFQEAGKFLESSPLILIQPFWTYFFHLIMICVGIILLILIAGVTDRRDTFSADFRDGVNRTLAMFVDREIVTYFWWYIVIGVIWTIEFTIAVQQLIIAGSVAEYYFSRDKKKLKCTICSASCRTIKYHLGSAAFGGFLITLVRIPRYILMKVAAKIESGKGEFAKFFVKCCVCCLCCLEKCLRYINRNAYIVIAINSTDFCVARVKAFKTLTDNILRVAAINSVGDFVLFLGKILIMAANVIISYFLFDRHNEGLQYGEMNLFFLPMLLVAIYSYLIAHCFLSSYEMLVDTLLLCFCEDVKLNDGTPEKPYFMSKSLMKFVANSNKTLKREKRDKDGADTPPNEGTESEKHVLSSADDTTASPDNIQLS